MVIKLLKLWHWKWERNIRNIEINVTIFCQLHLFWILIKNWLTLSITQKYLVMRWATRRLKNLELFFLKQSLCTIFEGNQKKRQCGWCIKRESKWNIKHLCWLKANLECAEFWSQNVMKMKKMYADNSYLEENLLPPMSGTEFSVLEWWKTNATYYAILSKLAQDILAILVSIISSESAFSTDGRVMDQYRN